MDWKEENQCSEHVKWSIAPESKSQGVVPKDGWTDLLWELTKFAELTTVVVGFALGSRAIKLASWSLERLKSASETADEFSSSDKEVVAEIWLTDAFLDFQPGG